MAEENNFASTQSVEKKSTTDKVFRVGGDFYHNNQLITKQEYQNLLKNTCPVAFAQYNHGRKLIKGGSAALGIGVGLMLVVGVPLYVSCVSYDYYNDILYLNYSMAAAGVAMMTIGGASIAAGVPLLCVGCSKRNRSVDTYNLTCGPDITYNLTAGQNGIGLAINF